MGLKNKVFEEFLNRIRRGELEKREELAARDKAFASELEAALEDDSLTGRQVSKLWRQYVRITRTDVRIGQE